MTDVVVDPFDVRRARSAPDLLREFNEAGVLAAADIHVAVRLCALVGVDDPAAQLATALAVRAPRLGHVYVDLATVRETVAVDTEDPVDLAALPWPDDYLSALAPLTDSGPLRLEGTRLYLDRYWREERQVADDLLALATADEGVDAEALGPRLDRVGLTDPSQRRAVASALLRRFAVVAGGPGTGKTTTVARIVALLPPESLVALAAPTGKAAARLEEAVHAEARTLDIDEDVRAKLLALSASTIHRLLGWRPGSHSRFRHHRGNKLPHDVVIVDETSMVSLSLMARLVESVRPGARLILVGDPGQLTSIEAGAVLGDIVGPAIDGPLTNPPPIGEGIVVLDRGFRFGTGIGTLAAAVRRGDADAVIETLAAAPEGVEWIQDDSLDGVRSAAVNTAREVIAAAADRDARTALTALGRFRILCAHRRGPHGVDTWMSQIESWIADETDDFTPGRRWYVGRPLLVTENDYELGLFNGDTGVVVAAGPGRMAAAFERRGDIVEFSPTRLASVETVYAMTVHKAQGSQFDTAAVLLPPPTSPILTRELLYTAVTRAQSRLILAGSEETVRAAVGRPAARASGLRLRLWRD